MHSLGPRLAVGRGATLRCESSLPGSYYLRALPPKKRILSQPGAGYSKTCVSEQFWLLLGNRFF